MNELGIMTEITSVKKRIYTVSKELGTDLVLVDRNILGNLIAEIEDKLDELEAITDPDFMKEVYMRVDEIDGGEVAGLNEVEILDLLEG
jgi:hypothetical protein